MQPILETLAKHIVDTHTTGTGEIRIILPNRRAALFLQQHLSKHVQHVGWMPVIYAIGDFIDDYSLLSLADPTEVILILYEIYAELKTNPESLDEFYFWGEVMVRDFDELDKYLVEPVSLFLNIKDLKEMEEPLAGLDPAQIEFVKQFWEGFHHGESTPEKEQFLEMWALLPRLYTKLRETMERRGEGYQGMQYREICGRIDRSEFAPLTGGRIIIAGFNALNGCEKQIFSWLQHHGAEFYWDYDHSYLNDRSSEAGRFMRSNMDQFPPGVELEPFRNLTNEKDIRIFELPSDVLQAKTAGRILEEAELPEDGNCTDTAIVLCDEDLLMPVLMSIPGSDPAINVTMGYPMRSTPVAGFVDLLFRLQFNARVDTHGMASFYHRDVRSVLLHPYMKGNGVGNISSLLDEMAARNMIQVEQQHFSEGFENMIFRPVKTAGDLIRYLHAIFMHILENLASEETGILPEIHREFVFRLLIQLNRMESLLSARPGITLQVMERVLRKMISGLVVPFEGEPLSGLQVMGILETRLLDFRHVILLSMNEEVMPAAQFRQSYIPYSLREAFGMPSREDMDAIYAYYFNRLLQRAEKVDLIYNSTSEGIRTGEMSRYLYQLDYGRDVEFIRPGMEVVAREKPALEIRHSREVQQKLGEYEATGKRYLSPSAINAYLDCTLKFYLRYLAGIGEPDEVQDEIDAAGFGTVVHETIRILYEEIAGRHQGMIDQSNLERITGTMIEKTLAAVFRDHHFRGRRNAVIEGRNLIIMKVMNRYLQKIIETDMKIAPFRLISTERLYSRELDIRAGTESMKINLGGKIDRVDRLGETLRVIDYKTGDAKTGFQNLESLFDPELPNRNGAALQTLIYGWLVSGDQPDEHIMPGLYVMKSLYNEAFDPRLSMGGQKQRTLIDSFTPLADEFHELLVRFLSSLFDPAVPFKQTENESKCRYCDFANICNRGTID